MSAPQATRADFDPAQEEQRLAERAARVTELALAGGAREAECYATRGETVVARFEKGDLKLTTVDEGTSLGLRVFREGRLGFASTNQSDTPALEQVASDALTLAAVSPPDEANALPRVDAPPAPLPLVHRSVAELGVEEVVGAGSTLVERTLAIDPRLSLDQSELSVARTTRAVHSSAGAAGTQSDARLSCSVFGMAIDGDDVGGFDYWGACLRNTDGLEAALDEVARRFAAGALGNLAAGQAVSYEGPVLLSPVALLEMLVEPLVSAASAIAVQRGRSALADKLGKVVASDMFHLTDDPTDVELSGARSFDREGVPTRRFPLVEGGVLAGFLYNGYAAQVEGKSSTGHAKGGTRGAPGLGPHALCVGAGSGGDEADLARSLGRGLLVQRFSGTVDPASGDLSGVAKSARWVEDGKVVRSVKETLVSGNAFELLRSLLALSSGTTNVMGGARAPWALVDGISVTAG